MSIGVYSYSAAAVFFLLLALLLLTSWRGRLQGALLVVAVVVSTLWATACAVAAASAQLDQAVYQIAEVVRSLAWFVFLFRLMQPLMGAPNSYVRSLRAVSYAVVALSLLGAVLFFVMPVYPGLRFGVDLTMIGHVARAVLGLAIVEQLFRNTNVDQKWAVKYLFFGLGAMFTFDFYMYADALLFKQVNYDLWAARGFVNALAVPLLIITAARNPQWSLDVFVSRKVVFHTVSLFGAGLYLVAMSAAGYYIRLYGGTWGVAVQTVFLFFSLTLLAVLLFSGQMRARVKVFFNKHFFNYNYDYREEWLRLIDTLSRGEPGASIQERSINALAKLVDSTGGGLYLQGEDGDYYCSCARNIPMTTATESGDGEFAQFIAQAWIIDLHQYRAKPAEYPGLILPAWLAGLDKAWLVVPLIVHEDLIGFVVLSEPRAPRQINWEDRDLLKTAGCQAASYLALWSASEALAEARQFEAFNRLSAFVVHDLKNLVAQLDLVVANAARHKDNPQFMSDAIGTVENAVAKMNRLLAQLRKGRFEQSGASLTQLDATVREAVEACSAQSPRPCLDALAAPVTLVAEHDRLLAVLCHIIQNAQDATAPDGEVVVSLRTEGQWAIVEVRDTGCGMDAAFIQDRLFRPFDTTKGNAGMGVGVYEAREFVRAMGGRVDVTSQPGLGTVFSLWFPQRPARHTSDPAQTDCEVAS